MLHRRLAALPLASGTPTLVPRPMLCPTKRLAAPQKRALTCTAAQATAAVVPAAERAQQAEAPPQEPPQQEGLAASGVRRLENGITVVEQDTGSETKKLLHVTISAERIKRALKKATAEVLVPNTKRGRGRATQTGGGARKLRLTDELLEQAKEIGKNYVIQAAAREAVLSTSYADAILTDTFKVKDLSPSEQAVFYNGEPVTIEVAFEVMEGAALKWRGDYKDLKVSVKLPKVLFTADELVDDRISSSLKEKAKLAVVQGRTLQMGDVAIVNISCCREGPTEDGSPQPELMSKQGVQVDTASKLTRLSLPGVVDGMVGMSRGTVKAISTYMPDRQWEEQGLKEGDRVVCTVALEELFEWDLPEATDAWAEEAVPGCGGLAGLRQQVGELVEANLKRQDEQYTDEALMKALADLVDMEVPEARIRELGENEYQTYLHQKQIQGKLTRTELTELVSKPEKLEAFVKDKREVMIDLERTIQAVDFIFEAEGMEVTDKEVAAEVKSTVEEMKALNLVDGEGMQEEKLREQVYELIKGQKVMAWLRENVKFTYEREK